MNMNKERTRVLKLLFLDPSTYHDASTTSKSMSVLCSIDAQYSCSQGDQALPGRCLIRSDKPYAWPEASNYCRSRGAFPVTIHNEKENKAFAQILRNCETAWLLPSHEKTWTAEKDVIDYSLFSEKGLDNLNCKVSQQAAIRKENATSGCTTYGLWRVEEPANKNIAICVKDAECPFCPPPKKADPVVCVGPGKYIDADGLCSTCESNEIPKGKTCEACKSGNIPDYVINKCVPDNRITCASYVDIPGEVHPCYCEERSQGRLTTNGLCRRKGKSAADCANGLIDVVGICVGTTAIQATNRVTCLSQMIFKTGTCVANEMLHLSSALPSAQGTVESALWCPNRLRSQGKCMKSSFNISIGTVYRSMGVVYFNSRDEPCFFGGDLYSEYERAQQDTYISIPHDWSVPRCTWAEGNIGFTRAWDFPGCQPNHWRAESKKCTNIHTLEVTGTGGSECFGFVNGALAPIWGNKNSVWTRFPGPQLPEKDYLNLPRTVIVPGDWVPERYLAPCPIGQLRIDTDQCVSCSLAPMPENRTRDEPMTCTSFGKQMIDENVPCYCDERTNGRFTTNGLCRRIGSDPCARAGLVDIAGVCVGADAIIATSRLLCLSLMMFRTGICVSNEMLYEKAVLPTCQGSYTGALWCGSHLQDRAGKCVQTYLNVSIRTGLQSFQVVYFNSRDEPIFLGDGRCERHKQETYCATPEHHSYPLCNWPEGNIGITRSCDVTGCEPNHWRAESKKCPNNHTFEITGKGGSECFGQVAGALDNWKGGGSYAWNRVPGPNLPEKDYLILPRVVIVPGDWIPERYLAPCPYGQLRVISDQCISCSSAPSIEKRDQDEPMNCASFAKQMISENLPCYCDERTQGRFTTNGLCRRIGTDPCARAGLMDVAGVCVGADAVTATSRVYCLSLMMFKTGVCVSNEMLYEKAVLPTCPGDFTGALWCGSHLQDRAGKCVQTYLNVSIRTGLQSFQVVHFNSRDEPIFLGDGRCDRNKQETYCATAPTWHYPRCNWPDGNIGFTRSCDTTGCEPNHWRAESKKCPNNHTLEISGKGGTECFGQVTGALDNWKGGAYIWNRIPGPNLPEKDYLNLPRVVIVPGEWIPERFLAPCPIGTLRIISDTCVACSNALRIEKRTHDESLTCASFGEQIISESLPCFCDERTKGRFTTNGLCRRIGTDPCAGAGLVDIAGVCVGSDAIVATSRATCLSLMVFRTGTCVANEMLYEKALTPTCKGSYAATPNCGTMLQEGTKCVTNPYNVSIRTGFASFQVVYFNGDDEPVFVGNGEMRSQQETYIPTPSNHGYPRCKWADGYIGWTRTTDATGCVENSWRAESEKCTDKHTIEISGKGGSECFGYVDGAFAPYWGKYIWTRVPGPELPEKNWLNLPRVVIVPGDWTPERVK